MTKIVEWLAANPSRIYFVLLTAVVVVGLLELPH